MSTVDAPTIIAAGLDDWRPLVHSLHARFRTGDFATGLDFLVDVGAAAEAANHHPDVNLTYTHVDITLTSHDAGAVTDRDLEMARTISDLAAERGLEADPGRLTRLEIALNAADKDAIGPFWGAVLTGEAQAYDGNQVADPTEQVPLLWFQPTPPRDDVPQMCFHLDIWIPAGQLPARIEAAVAAGGRVVDDSESPSFVVLEDAEGNKACLCTVLDRS
ncbi:4a-hydroxytetrahydrobiopterin dehydratase [Aeromicrobium senzhongii]|uniref:Putative pterin-4-alpha-carbinolamine dehydratase n=1 Tax=Aeromicrobium senzhongii TaxID=2663859 RepID=A0ABX6SV52_9ACTN|nr:4a-hydroxytetrahydrobiopterin dehydratase [Aeromicrobium senzhongii]MTB87094.1 4a-hydroxytetrahydrobiopterin dehydratase [Aeromicrobium senzhongii]QNL93090.1 4a-hydroxytetrahydrobiopterin dehydratase [Aeromicrobium senzhongii]